MTTSLNLLGPEFTLPSCYHVDKTFTTKYHATVIGHSPNSKRNLIKSTLFFYGFLEIWLKENQVSEFFFSSRKAFKILTLGNTHSVPSKGNFFANYFFSKDVMPE